MQAPTIDPVAASRYTPHSASASRLTAHSSAHGSCSRRSLLAALFAPAIALAAPALAHATTGIEDRYTDTGALHGIINNVRHAHGLAPLQRSVRLDGAARAHASDMALHGFVAHTSSDGTAAPSRIRQYYDYPGVLGETLGGGFTTAVDLVRAWLASPGHRAVLLGAEFQALGMACIVRSDAPHRWYWTADYGGEAD